MNDNKYLKELLETIRKQDLEVIFMVGDSPQNEITIKKITIEWYFRFNGEITSSDDKIELLVEIGELEDDGLISSNKAQQLKKSMKEAIFVCMD
jgi:hypothetical protein